ncbi:hypothetical protein LTR74_003363 [Friedmanniomyces endolithicus]|nr:hypothetical protein LTR74_003363 [Friedmanniomyces endolithicus]
MAAIGSDTLGLRDALHRIMVGQPQIGDVDQVVASASTERGWAKIVGVCVDLRPEQHDDVASFSHPNASIATLRRKLWTPSRLAGRVLGSRTSLRRPQLLGVGQRLWRSTCAWMNLPENLHASWRSGMIAWGTLDSRFPGRSDDRTGVRAVSAAVVPVQKAFPGAASLFRDVAILQMKRQLGILHEAVEAAPSEQLQSSLRPIVEQLGVSISGHSWSKNACHQVLIEKADEIHAGLLGCPLPAWVGTPRKQSDKATGAETPGATVSKGRKRQKVEEHSPLQQKQRRRGALAKKQPR